MKSLYQLYREHDGKVSDKWTHYLRVYDRLFAPLRNRSLTILEIGVQNGGSLEIWAKYFPAASVLVGCDINPDCQKLEYDDPRIKLIVGDANADDIERQISSVADAYDIIIDDGSHLSSDIVRSFVRYFPKLKPDGIYVAEDMHCSYWREYLGGLYSPYSSMAFFKRLADIINHEHWGTPKSISTVCPGLCRRYSVDLDAAVCATVGTIEFSNSMVVVQRCAADRGMLGKRVVAGKSAAIEPSPLDFDRAYGSVPCQQSNQWAMLKSPPEEQWDYLDEYVMALKEQVSNQNKELDDARREGADSEARFRGLSARVDAMEASISWKLTAPLRFLGRQLGRLVSRDDGLSFVRLPLEALAILTSPLFDIGYYRASYPVPGPAWLARFHFLTTGCRLGYNPNPLFDIKYYLDMNPEIRVARWNPFAHYLRCGARQGRRPHPLVALQPRQQDTGRQGNGECPIAHFYREVLGETRTAAGHMKRLFDTFGLERDVGEDEGELGLRWLEETIRSRLASRPDTVEPNDYQTWVTWYRTITPTMRRIIKLAVSRMEQPPLISVVMPTFNSNPDWLEQAICSVCNQLYPHWELCIADDASTDARVAALLGKYSARDRRIKVAFRETNGHIAECSNSALALATGDWIVLLDHDDVLAEDALYQVAKGIGQNPDVEMIYSDEDKVDEKGNTFAAYFKPDWNLDLFYSQNCFSHLGCYKKSLVEQAGGFRAGYEGSQDYDLALRCLAFVRSGQIRHIPAVLYHWRVHQESTACDASAKPYAMKAGEKALNDHFQRQNIRGKVALQEFGYRASYEMPHPIPLVSIIIPVHNGYPLFRKCIESLLNETSYLHYELIIIDNQSDDPLLLSYLHELSGQKNTTILFDDRPFNFSALNNLAVKRAHGEYVALVNSDTEIISADWLVEMVSVASQPGVGAVGARLLYPDQRLQHGGLVLGLGGGVAGHVHKGFARCDPGYFGRAALRHSVSAVTGACLVVKRALYDEVGGLDEVHLPVSYNDVDFCLKVKSRGYRNVWTPYAELIHHESASRGYECSQEKLDRLKREAEWMKSRWGEWLLNDTCYSPNLSLDYENCSLAWPPRTSII